MKLALTGGGTGGHIIPALAVMEAVQARLGGTAEVCFFGPEDRGERARVESAGVRFVGVPSAALRGRGPLGLARSAWRLLRGTLAAIRALRRFSPDAVFSTGGYGSFPGSLASKLLRRPLVVYLPDVHPGWAVKAERLLATRMTTTTEAALEFLPAKKTVVTGYPVRQSFFTTDREIARSLLNIAHDERIVVIAGATQGAGAINRAVLSGLDRLLASAVVYHVTGQAGLPDAERALASLPSETRGRYRPSAFRDDLPQLMVAADLGVFRAGASVLGEIPAANLPSILVPGTFAGGHQRNNARWLADAGAGVVVEEADLTGLVSTVQTLLADTPRLLSMREAARSLARPDAADAIAKVVLEVARK
ncbi:MAG: UDP-N-acetylglucosamine--N-acetylmuramyl-(pentapeptide) pyrophosphoryl-undecaprenol N-acetylglucosamine transferase [bacterium]